MTTQSRLEECLDALTAAEQALAATKREVENLHAARDAAVWLKDRLALALRATSKPSCDWLSHATVDGRAITQTELRAARAAQTRATKAWLRAEGRMHDQHSKAAELRLSVAGLRAAVQIRADDFIDRVAVDLSHAAGRSVSACSEVQGDSGATLWVWPSEIEDADAFETVAVGIACGSGGIRLIDGKRRAIGECPYSAVENVMPIVERRMAETPVVKAGARGDVSLASRPDQFDGLVSPAATPPNQDLVPNTVITLPLTVECMLTDGVPALTKQKAVAAIHHLRHDIEALANVMLAASRIVVLADFEHSEDARAAVEVWSADHGAATQLPPGARRQSLYALRDDIVEMVDWLNNYAGPSVIAAAKRDRDEDLFICLAIIVAGRGMLAALPPDPTRRLRYISMFSGMEACSAALEGIGADAEPVAFAEIDPAASAVLSHKWPGVPNHGDISAFDWSVYNGQVCLVAGGSPCQSFSVAGKRLGLDDPRGNLALHYLKAIDAIKPRVWLFENVPGLLTSGTVKGDDFRTFLRLAMEIGYSVAWRILDARHCGLPRSVPQRRRRLYIVGYFGDAWQSPAAVLLEQEGEGWNLAAGGGSQEEVAAHTRRRSAVGLNNGDLTDETSAYALYKNGCSEVEARRELTYASAFGGSEPGVGIPVVAHSYAADMRNGGISSTETGTLQAACGNGRGQSLNALPCIVEPRNKWHYNLPSNGNGATCPTLTHRVRADRASEFVPSLEEDSGPTNAFQSLQSGDGTSDTYSKPDAEERPRRANCVDPANASDLQSTNWVVRRLTPLECSRLQGFPDDWLDGVRLRNRPLSDSNKYKLTGNSWAVPCAAWILDRILKLDNLLGFAASVEQQDAFAEMMTRHGFEVFENVDHRPTAFCNGTDLGLLLAGWDNRGPLVKIVAEDNNPVGLDHPMSLVAGLKALGRQDLLLAA